MTEKNKVYILQHRRGWNFLRWIWLSTNLFVTIKFHDIQKEMSKLPKEGGEIFLFREEYLDFLTKQKYRGELNNTYRISSLLVNGDDMFLLYEDNEDE